MPFQVRRRSQTPQPIPSDEVQARQTTLQIGDTGVQGLAEGNNGAVGVGRITAGLLTPLFSRRDSYQEMWTIFRHRYDNVLLVFVPAGIVAGALGLPAELVFWLNFLAVVPLAPLITMAILKLSADAGPLRGGLLKAIFGNMAEMIICILAMINGQIQLVKWIIVGSTLSYSLLVLGCSFLVASFGRDTVEFSNTQVSVLSSLMMVVSISLVIPTVMSTATPPEYDDTNNILTLSHATGIVLFMLFVSYSFFRFRTHEAIFTRAPYNRGTANPTNHIIGDKPGLLSSPWVLRLIFISASLCVIACGRYIIHSIEDSMKRMGITKSFAGIVLIPLMGNIAKSVAIVTASRTRRLDLAIRAVMSNVLDTLLFITPFLVLLGWIINRPMELEFGFFEATIFLLAIIIMTYLLQHGKTTYFEGAMLMGTYFVIAVTFYIRPEALENGTPLGPQRNLITLGAKTSQPAV